jgi:hypothetical protein
MQRARIRRWVVLVLAVLAAASMFPSFGGGSSRHQPAPRQAKPRAAATTVDTGVRAGFHLAK